jgi:peptidyl-dipeptidase Dcp
LENVKKGIFDLSNRLFGLTFEERTELPTPHPDATAYEVKEADGSHVGILYVDYHPRESKRGGAWMSSYRKQYTEDGENVPPVITNVMNFSKPTGDKPALLSVEEVQTLFHEFGHGLHGLLSQCTYESLSGTSVARDFVELPSQIMENWVLEPEMLKLYAKHYETGEVIPDELIAKIKESGTFNTGFALTEYLAASVLDMDYHTITEPITVSAAEFETASMEKFGLISEIIPRYRSTYFRHIFAGGYSAGYYSYMWAEVLDADAYEAFKENGISDKETATAFRENILAKGGTEDPMELYKKFRGTEPKIEPYKERKGLVN